MTTVNRKELLEARSQLERQIDDLSYRAIIGRLAPSGKPALLERLKGILAEIDQRLVEMGQ